MASSLFAARRYIFSVNALAGSKSLSDSIRFSANIPQPNTPSAHGGPNARIPIAHEGAGRLPNVPDPKPIHRAKPRRPASKRTPPQAIPAQLPPAVAVALRRAEESSAARLYPWEALRRLPMAAELKAGQVPAHKQPGVPHTPSKRPLPSYSLTRNTIFSFK
jgi:hypothetical protein